MKIGKDYTGTVKAVKIVGKSIKGPEDEKIQKQVGIVEVESEYNAGDLSELVVGATPEDIYATSIVWNDEIVGFYDVDINDIVFKARIIKIARKNKDVPTFSLTFETEDLESLSGIGLYVKIKETPSNFTINKSE